MLKRFFISLFILNACLAPMYFCLADTPANSTGATNNPVTIVSLENPIRASSVPKLIGTIIGAALVVIGSIALLVFFRAANSWLFSAGNPEMVKKGLNGMLYAAIGVALVFLSYILINATLGVVAPSK